MLELLPTEAGILRAHLASVLTWGSWRNQPLFPGDPCQLFSQPRAQAGVQGRKQPKGKAKDTSARLRRLGREDRTHLLSS